MKCASSTAGVAHLIRIYHEVRNPHHVTEVCRQGRCSCKVDFGAAQSQSTATTGEAQKQKQEPWGFLNNWNMDIPVGIAAELESVF